MASVRFGYGSRMERFERFRFLVPTVPLWKGLLGDGPNTFSESTVSNAELSEFFGPHRVPAGELSDFLSAHY